MKNKYKYLFMLPAISLATSSLSSAQKVADVPAAAKINLKAELKEAHPAKAMYDKLADMITQAAKKNGAEVDGKKILDALALNDITSYAMSSAKDGNQWQNIAYLHNGGSEKGIFALLGKKNATFTAPEICPAGSDLVFQMDLDLRTLEQLITKIIPLAGEDASQIDDFKKKMAKNLDKIEMTPSEILEKLNARVNFALDLDKNVQLAVPMVGQINKPHLVIRLDGITWIWKKMGDDMLNETGAPFQKKEENGIITYSIPPQMAAGLMGYAPQIIVDTKKDHIWVASSSEFLKKCMAGAKPLSKSLAYKAATQGLASKGNVLSYMSKDFADLIVGLYGSAKTSGLMKSGGGQKEIDKAMELLKNIKTALVSTMSKDDGGILFTGRGPKNYKETIEEMEKNMKNLGKHMLHVEVE